MHVHTPASAHTPALYHSSGKGGLWFHGSCLFDECPHVHPEAVTFLSSPLDNLKIFRTSLSCYRPVARECHRGSGFQSLGPTLASMGLKLIRQRAKDTAPWWLGSRTVGWGQGLRSMTLSPGPVSASPFPQRPDAFCILGLLTLSHWNMLPDVPNCSLRFPAYGGRVDVVYPAASQSCHRYLSSHGGRFYIKSH